MFEHGKLCAPPEPACFFTFWLHFGKLLLAIRKGAQHNLLNRCIDWRTQSNGDCLPQSGVRIA